MAKATLSSTWHGRVLALKWYATFVLLTGWGMLFQSAIYPYMLVNSDRNAWKQQGHEALNSPSTDTELKEDHFLPSILAGSESFEEQSYFATAMIIETRCHPGISLVIKQAAKFLGPEFKIVVYHSKKNKECVQGIIDTDDNLRPLLHNNKQQRLQLREINEEDYGYIEPHERKTIYDSEYWYSRMLLNHTFWAEVDTPYAMVLQSDSLLCRPFPIEEFTSRGESFLGGLSGYQGEKPKRIHVDVNPSVKSPKTFRNVILNGGLSLRNVEWTKACVQFVELENADLKYAEDCAFAHCQRANIKGTVVATQLQAYSFSSDNGSTLCFDDPSKPGNATRVCPAGVHKPWKWGPKKWGKGPYRELRNACPGLRLHERLNKKSESLIQETTETGVFKSHDIDGSFTAIQCNECIPQYYSNMTRHQKRKEERIRKRTEEHKKMREKKQGEMS